jgi:pimeloyl-ACP methyl ester carboxylesterase
MHPRLFASLVLIDPVIETGSTLASEASDTSSKFGIAAASTYRRDVWPSREEAAKSFAKSPFYQKWDKRVLDRWIQYGLRDLPTLLYPEKTVSGSKPVTLTTSKHQEVWTFLRPNYEGHGVGGVAPRNRFTIPDVDPSSPIIAPFYRPESLATFIRLPQLRPPTFYLLGGDSTVSAAGRAMDKVEATGTGVGGSGGMAENKVGCVVLPGIGHLVPMEVVDRTAEEIAKWLQQVLNIWFTEEEAFKKSRDNQDRIDNIKVNKDWLNNIGKPPGANKPKKDTKL